MRYLLLLFFLLFPSLAHAQTGITAQIPSLDQCLWVEESDGSPANNTCGKLKVTNGALTDNGDGTYSLSVSGVGGSPGGSDTQIQYNQAGSFGGLSTFTTDGTDLTFTGTLDIGGGGLEIGNSTTLPATCSVGEIYFDTDATSGQRIYGCESANTWILQGDGGGSSPWTDSGTTTYLTTTTDDLVIGGTSPLNSSKFSIDGDADQIQGIFQGNATQTSDYFVVEQSDGTDIFTIDHTGSIGIGTSAPTALTHIVDTDTHGTGLTDTFKVEYTGTPNSAGWHAGIKSRMHITGATGGSPIYHNINIFGYGSDVSTNQQDIIGVEGRIDGASTHSGISYTGLLSLPQWSDPDAGNTNTFAGNVTGINADANVFLNDGATENFEGTATALQVSNVSGGATTYGILVLNQTGTVGTSDYGIVSQGAQTQNVWLDTTDAGTQASGIAFGSSRDVVLYRSQANQLATPDTFVANTAVATNGLMLVYDSGFSNELNIEHDSSRAEIATTGGHIALSPFTGNVGIGTTAPTYALDVVGTLQADGQILPQGTTCGSTLEGEICWDTDNDTLYAGNGSAAQKLTHPTETKCFVLPSTAAADDNIPLGSVANAATTVENVWCTCSGTCTTKATFGFEDGAGNAMTGSPTCVNIGTVATATAITAGGSLTAREDIRFDVTNTPSPETDTYTICVEFSYD